VPMVDKIIATHANNGLNSKIFPRMSILLLVNCSG
jgi:hypothetical protein